MPDLSKTGQSMIQLRCFSLVGEGGGAGGGLPYKHDRDPHRKIKIKPLRETNVGVVQG